jgi:cytosine deaminase
VSAALLLRNARLADGDGADLLLREGWIVRLAPAGSLAVEAHEVVDLGEALLLPAFVEGHIHLDKTLLGLPWQPHLPGAKVVDRVNAEKRLRASLAMPVQERARRLVEQAVAFGTGHMRCHVDIDGEVGLGGLEQLLELREAVRHLVDIQLVAFPQSGVIREPKVVELLDQALGKGCALVGGLDPAGFDGDIEGQLDILFELAGKHHAGLDIHLHDPGELGAFELRAIALRAQAMGLQGRVAVSHAYALGMVDEPTLLSTAEALARGGVAIMTSAPGNGPMPPVAKLRTAGVTVFAGSDNIRDAWSPMGDGDMLNRARLVAYRQGFATDEQLAVALDLATDAAARALGIESYGIREGGRADLVAVRAAHVPEAVVACPPRILVIKRGQVVARNGQILEAPAVTAR